MNEGTPIGGRICLICGEIPISGCRHHASTGIAPPELPLRVGIGGGLMIDSTIPITLQMNPRTGTPAMGADLESEI